MQVPDLDALIQTSDFPCMLSIQPGTGALAPPIFGYNSHEKFVDIPFPDYSYWGHEYRRLLGGCSPHSFFFDCQQVDMKSGHQNFSLEQGSAQLNVEESH